MRKKLMELAEQIGFSQVCPLNLDALTPLEEIRAMCEANRCQNFQKSWSCPPACGDLATIQHHFSRFRAGILVQTTGQLADAFDITAIGDTEKRHKTMFDTLVRQTKIYQRTCFPMASGACTRCRKCTYPNRPCRYPDRLYPSMEACGLWVSDVCEKSGLGYYYGPNTITYTACILIDPKMECDSNDDPC